MKDELPLGGPLSARRVPNGENVRFRWKLGQGALGCGTNEREGDPDRAAALGDVGMTNFPFG